MDNDVLKTDNKKHQVMDYSPLHKSYEFFTQKLGDITRQLSFSGIAVVWIFSGYKNENTQIPKLLLYALLAFIVTLFFDLLHYYYGAARDGIIRRNKEKRANRIRAQYDECDIEVISFSFSKFWNWPKIIIKFLTPILVLVGYALLGCYVLGTIS